MIMGMMDDASEANFLLHQTDLVMMMVVVVMWMVMMTVIEVLNRALDHHSDHYCYQSANHRKFQKNNHDEHHHQNLHSAYLCWRRICLKRNNEGVFRSRAKVGITNICLQLPHHNDIPKILGFDFKIN